jgi:NitT/TauT family transport system substrate-binding protein
MARPLRIRLVSTLAASVLAVGLAGCGGADTGSSDQTTLRLGYFPNITHAPAIVGVKKNFFTEKLGPNVKLDTKTFNAGPDALTALLSGALDVAFIGPNPTVNGWVQTKGKGVVVVAGAASGGVSFVVKPEINTAQDLKGTVVSSPQLGNTQDVALRYWLKQQGLTATREGGGDVSIKPQANSDIVTSFSTGAIAGAWVPEPYASQLVAKGGKVLVDERTLWPNGQFVITNVLVSRTFYDKHKDVVKNLIAGEIAANDWIKANPAEAQAVTSDAIGKITGKPLDPKLVAAAWPKLTFTADPLAATLKAGADHAVEVGLLEQPDLTGLYDLTPLNQVLQASGSPQVQP